MWASLAQFKYAAGNVWCVTCGNVGILTTVCKNVTLMSPKFGRAVLWMHRDATADHALHTFKAVTHPLAHWALQAPSDPQGWPGPQQKLQQLAAGLS